MIQLDIIARYEALRRHLADIEKQLGVEGSLADEEANRIDAELVELEGRLPDGTEVIAASVIEGTQSKAARAQKTAGPRDEE